MTVQSRAPALLIMATLGGLASCGGGGSGGSGGGAEPTAPPPVAGVHDDPSPVPAGAGFTPGAACDSPFYDQLLGQWQGSVEYDDTARDGAACAWTAALEIAGRSLATECILDAVATSTVVQSVVPDADSAAATECLDGTYRFEIDTSLVSIYQPVPDADFDYPVVAGWRNAQRPGQPPGPYFGDPAVVRPYTELFAGRSGTSDRCLEIYPDQILYRQVFGDGSGRFAGAFERPDTDP